MPRHEYRNPILVDLDEQAHADDSPVVVGPAPYSSRSPAPGPAFGGGGGGRGRVGRRLLTLLVVVFLCVPYVLSLNLFWSRAGGDLRFAETERAGVAYLRPLVRLLAAAAYQESLDVAGTPGDGQRLRLAVRDVDAADATLGDTLSVHERWAEIRRSLQALLNKPPRADAAAEEFGPTVDLIVALVGAVGDRSSLILDPNLESYYLVDATLVRLPSVLVDASRLSDTLHAAPAVRAVRTAVLTDRIRSQSEALDSAMRKSFAATQTNVMTSSLISRLDRFGDAVTTMAPPTAGLGGTVSPAGSLNGHRDQVRETGLQLEDAALTQLDGLLAERIATLTYQRRLETGVALAGVLLAGLAGWPLLSRRRGTSPGPATGASGALAGLLPPRRSAATGRGD